MQVQELLDERPARPRPSETGRSGGRARRRRRRALRPAAGRRHRAGPGGARIRRAGRDRPCSGTGGGRSRSAAHRRRPTGSVPVGVGVASRRRRPARRQPRRRPDEPVGDEHPATRRAAGREQVADRDLQAGFAPRATRPGPGTRRRGAGRPAAGARPRPASGSAASTRSTPRGAGGRCAARATQPPRPARSATTSPGPVCASMRLDEEARRRGGRGPLELGQGHPRIESRSRRTPGHGREC